MSRVLLVAMTEDEVTARCATEDVGISAIEALPGGGVRLVCMSADGAETMKAKLKRKMLADTAVRAAHRPRTPLW